MKKGTSILLSAMIVLTVLFIYAYMSVNPISAFKRRDSNYYALKNTIVGCQSVEKIPEGKKVILRIDDPHAFFLDEVVFKMVDDATAHNAPVVLGVVPKDIEKDTQLTTFLKHNLCNFEVALHGWDHSENPPEFQNLSEQEAFERMSRGKWVLESLLNTPVTTFIAPQNSYSEGTIKAAKRIGFKIFTSEGEGLNGYDATTYDFGDKKLVPVYDIVHQCMDSFDENKPCIVMIHPQDFTTGEKLDKEKYKNYLEVIEVFQNLDVSFITFQDLPEMDYGVLGE